MNKTKQGLLSFSFQILCKYGEMETFVYSKINFQNGFKFRKIAFHNEDEENIVFNIKEKK